MTEQEKHELIDDTLVCDSSGIVARCTCGWVSRGHFSSMVASLAMQEHVDEAERKTEGGP